MLEMHVKNGPGWGWMYRTMDEPLICWLNEKAVSWKNRFPLSVSVSRVKRSSYLFELAKL